MILKIQAIRFSKDYFSNYESCMVWLESQSLVVSKYEELDNFYVFEHISKDKFNESSMQEMSLGGGVVGSIGVSVETETTLANVSDADPVEPVVNDDGIVSLTVDWENTKTSMMEYISDKLSEFTDKLGGVEKTVEPVEPVVNTTVIKSDDVEPVVDTPVINSDDGHSLTMTVPIIKKTAERVVFGEVLVPNKFDAQGHTYTSQDVEKASHYWMKEFQQLGEMHSKMLDTEQIQLLETYVAPTDFDIGDKNVKKGTWLLKVFVADDDLWEKVDSGEYTGFSIQGLADAETLDD